jgi:hypothetical protein
MPTQNTRSTNTIKKGLGICAGSNELVYLAERRIKISKMTKPGICSLAFRDIVADHNVMRYGPELITNNTYSKPLWKILTIFSFIPNLTFPATVTNNGTPKVRIKGLIVPI